MDNIKCFNCGIVYNGNFCPNCGAPAVPPAAPPNYQNPPYQAKRKNNKPGCLVIAFILIFIFFVIGIVGVIFANMIASPSNNTSSKPSVNLQTTEAPSDKETETSLLEFDQKTWKHFKALYVTHNGLMESINAYANSSVTSLDFYNYCVEIKKYFQKASLGFNFGTTDDQETYLSSFELVALSDQQAAEALIKYIDSGKTSDLSKAQEHIKKAKSAFEMIASNRGTLLVKAGLTDKEITEKIETDMAQLEIEMAQ